MQITEVAVEALIPYAKNSRTHDDAQVAQIAASIKEFGWTNPILVDGENGIIAGHGRIMAAKKLGMTAVTGPGGVLLGIFTDGDLRRLLERSIDVHNTLIRDVIRIGCSTVSPECLAAEGVRIMEEKRISALLVVDSNNQLVGALNMHDLLRAGVV